MPNIAKTGIQDVDDEYKPGGKEESNTFGMGGLASLKLPIGEAKKTKFCKYTPKNYI